MTVDAIIAPETVVDQAVNGTLAGNSTSIFSTYFGQVQNLTISLGNTAYETAQNWKTSALAAYDTNYNYVAGQVTQFVKDYKESSVGKNINDTMQNNYVAVTAAIVSGGVFTDGAIRLFKKDSSKLLAIAEIFTGATGLGAVILHGAQESSTRDALSTAMCSGLLYSIYAASRARETKFNLDAFPFTVKN